jgi:branched-chain amino acid transport system permease protein
MSAQYLAQQLINALSYGSILALLAIGYTMIYGILGLINFAHGEIFMIGAFACFGVVEILGMSFPAGFIAAIAGSVLAGLLIERFVYRPCLRRSPGTLTIFIASFGASLGMRNLFTMLLGDGRRQFPTADFLEGIIVTDSGLTVGVKDLWIIGVTVVMVVAVSVFVKYAKAGIAMRAVAYDANAARLVGVNGSTAVLTAFVLASALAGVSAVAYGVSYGIVTPSMGYRIGLDAFIAAVLGGVGSVPGAAVAGYIIGLGEILFVALLPPDYSAVRTTFVWALLLFILFLKPSGLFRPNMKNR